MQNAITKIHGVIIAMKNGKFKNLIFEFLSKVKIKKFLLVIYCVVPILIFSVGFAAWRITGSDVSGIASGSFLTYDVINSYDYVPEINLSSNGNGLYPTRFYDDTGSPVSVANIDVTATIDLKNCSKLADTLYAEFTLSFLNGSTDEFFNGLSITKLQASQTSVESGFTSFKTSTGADITDFSEITSLGDASYSCTYGSKITAGIKKTNDTFSYAEKTNSSYKVKFTINTSVNEGESATEGVQTADSKLYLKITYTLDPSVADYITLYEKLVDKNLKFLIDVKIYN